MSAIFNPADSQSADVHSIPERPSGAANTSAGRFEELSSSPDEYSPLKGVVYGVGLSVPLWTAIVVVLKAVLG